MYEMLLILSCLFKNLFHYPHQSIQDVQGSAVTPYSYSSLPRGPLIPSKEGEGLEESSIVTFTVISFHQLDMLAFERRSPATPHLQQSLSRAYWQVNLWVTINRQLFPVMSALSLLEGGFFLLLPPGLICAQRGRKAE